MDAGRELDALVAEKVFGFTEPPEWLDACGRWRKEFSPYSTDIGAAWQVVERIQHLHAPPDVREEFANWLDSPDGIDHLMSLTAPQMSFAICRAALAAVGAEIPV